MVEIYNEQVRDLLSSDGTQKKYPFFLTPFFLLAIYIYIFVFSYEFSWCVFFE